MDSVKDEIKNKKQLYLENDYSPDIEYPIEKNNQINEENNLGLKPTKESISKLASKRPIQRAKEPLDIEPLDENNLADDNKKLEKLEIDDPW